jgi:hypothetical protein
LYSTVFVFNSAKAGLNVTSASRIETNHFFTVSLLSARLFVE